MRNVIVLEHISMDGVIQAPGGPDEDTSGGFASGGLIAPYSDPIIGTALRKQWRYCRKDCQNQAAAGAGFARVGQ